MKTLYFDCFSGISGDMVLGAFMDLGVSVDYVSAELEKLQLQGYRIEAKACTKRGISGTKCHVIIEEEDGHDGHDHHDHKHHDHHHRHYGNIKEIIEHSTLDAEVKKTAMNIFERVAVAEAKVHKVPVDQVHFHEVGALDSIIDIVGAAICYHKVMPDIVCGSRINVGSGWLTCDHGTLPVPAPATAEILCDSNFEIYSENIDGEATTPTGAAIIAELAEYSPEIPSFVPEKIGYGFGDKEFDVLNALRVIQGKQAV